MGALVEQPIKTIFNGVSRQPHTVRLPGQVEEMLNAIPSVVSGGFEKRPSFQHIEALTGASAADYFTHFIDRDTTEKYLVLIAGDGTIKVYDLLTGAAKTVNALAADAVAYLTGLPGDFAAVSVADYTFVVNRDVIVELDTATVGTITGYKKTFSELNAVVGPVGAIYKITGEATELDDYYVTWNATQASWVECANPNGQNSFKATTMPYTLVRNVDATFTFAKATWESRDVGDANSVEAPPFVGKMISDVVFHRNRLGIVADEKTYHSQSGDFFNMWPEKATEVLDSDPVELAATTNKVSILQWAVPFRKSLFVTSEQAQFEISAGDGGFTPHTAVMDLATSYFASKKCRPVAMGDELYFASKDQNNTIVYEYYWDDNTLSNTASDVLKHAQGYVPAEIVQMTAAPAADRLFLRADAAGYEDAIFVYTTYWDGEKKAQSAWCQWTLNGSVILGMAVVEGYLYAVVRYGSSNYLMKCPVNTEPPDATLASAVMPKGWTPLLDRRTVLTGIYDAVTNKTTWTFPYTHGDAGVVVTGGGFPAGRKGRRLTTTYPTSTTASAIGDWSAATVYAGLFYESDVELSRQYQRDEQGAAILTGKTRIKYITVSFLNTGYFEVRVTPKGRDTKVRKMSGMFVGSTETLIGDSTILDKGTFRAKVKSDASTVRIVISNPSHLPHVITSAAWVGFFNEITRQE